MSVRQKFPVGLAYALSAFLLWGLVPVYFKWVGEVSPFEVLSHRIFWSVVILFFVIVARKQWRQVRALKRKTVVLLLLSSLLICTNWFTFIWAVGQDRILETSLGYFINPLLNVCLGVLFLGERLRKFQLIAVCFAMIGVVNQIYLVGSLPWIALVLALSFGFYGLIRKLLEIDPAIGLFVETALMLPLALPYMVWLDTQASLMFSNSHWQLDLLLMSAGFVTTIPLLLFAAGAKRISLSQLGITQYLTPSITFLLALFIYQEPFDLQQLVTFSCIWLGLILFTVEGVFFRKPRPAPAVVASPTILDVR